MLDVGQAPNVSKAPTAISVRGNIRELFNQLSAYEEEHMANTPEAAENVKNAFREFLIKCDYKLALKNFDALLAEKSGDKAFRDDGTVNWYHELVPLLMIMDLAKRGKKNGGFNLKDLEEWGGLEVAIISHLRHDSAEDFITKEDLLQQMKSMIAEIKREEPNADIAKYQRQMLLSMDNIELMTQKRLFNSDGSPKLRADGKQDKEDIVDFSHRMLKNPIVIMLKMADLIHNGATLLRDEVNGPLARAQKLAKASLDETNLQSINLDTATADSMPISTKLASKFSPQKILERCNRMEDIYGRRFGIAIKAMKRWESFGAAIKTLDHTMGAVLYPHFRYLANVDLFHKKPYYKYPVDLDEYMDNATKWSLKGAWNILHVSFKRMANSVDPTMEPEKFERLSMHMRHVILPALEPWKGHFGYLFNANDNDTGGNRTAAPVPQTSVA